MDVLLAWLQLLAFVVLGLALVLPDWRRFGIGALAVAAAAAVGAGLLEPGPRTLETVHTYAGFEGSAMEVSMVRFPTGTASAPGWQWPLPFAAFAALWIGVLVWLGSRPLRRPVVTSLSFAWSGTAVWLGMQWLAAPAAIVQPVGLDRVLYPAGLALALGVARTAKGLPQLFFGISLGTFAARLPAAIFSKVASDRRLGTSLDVSSIRDIVNPMTQTQFEPRLAAGSPEQQFWLIWLEHVIVFPAIYLLSLVGIAFGVHMFWRHGPAPRLDARR